MEFNVDLTGYTLEDSFNVALLEGAKRPEACGWVTKADVFPLC